MAKPTWITLNKTNGSGDNTFIITTAAHTGREARSGTVTVTGTGTTAKTITVSLEAHAEYALFDSTTYAADKDGQKVTITGKSNSPYLNFKLIGAATASAAATIVATKSTNCLMRFFDSAQTGNALYSTSYKSETAKNVQLPATFTASSKANASTTGNNTEFIEDLGKAQEYTFSITLTIPANTGTLPLKITLEVNGSTSVATHQTVITLAAATAFVYLYENQGDTAEITKYTQTAAGGTKTIYVDSNTSWSIS